MVEDYGTSSLDSGWSTTDYSSGYSTSGSDDAAAAVLGLFGGALGIGAMIVMFVIWLAIMIVFLWMGGRLFKKMGYSPWMVLLQLIPLVNFGIFIWLAFTEWPVEKKVKELEASKK